PNPVQQPGALRFGRLGEIPLLAGREAAAALIEGWVCRFFPGYLVGVLPGRKIAEVEVRRPVQALRMIGFGLGAAKPLRERIALVSTGQGSIRRAERRREVHAVEIIPDAGLSQVRGGLVLRTRALRSPEPCQSAQPPGDARPPTPLGPALRGPSRLKECPALATEPESGTILSTAVGTEDHHAYLKYRRP